MRPTRFAVLSLLLSSTLPISLCSSASGEDQEAAPKPAARVTRMTLDLKDIPLRRSLEMVLQGSGVICEVDESIPDVPVTVRLYDVPLRTAVKRIVASAGAQVKGAWVDFSGSPWRVARGGGTARGFRGPNTRVSLDVLDVPLREALDRLFADTDAQCLVDANVPDVPVSVRFQNLTLHSGAALIAGSVWTNGVPVSVLRSGANYQVGLAKIGDAYNRASLNLTSPKRKRSNLRLHYLPLRQAVRTIPAKPGTQLLVEPNVPDVRLKMRMRNLSTESAVSQLVAVSSLRAPGITYVRSGNVFVICRPTPPVRETRVRQSAGAR